MEWGMLTPFDCKNQRTILKYLQELRLRVRLRRLYRVFLCLLSLSIRSSASINMIRFGFSWWVPLYFAQAKGYVLEGEVPVPLPTTRIRKRMFEYVSVNTVDREYCIFLHDKEALRRRWTQAGQRSLKLKTYILVTFEPPSGNHCTRAPRLSEVSTTIWTSVRFCTAKTSRELGNER